MDGELKKLDLSSAAPLPTAQPGDKPPKLDPNLNAKLRIVMWIAMIGGPLVLAIGGYELYRARQLKSVGKEVVGKLHTSETLNTGKGRTSYQIIVDYRPPDSDTKYRKRFVVSEEDYQQAKATGECKVVCLSNDPTFSAVGEPTNQASEMMAIGIGVFLFGVGVWWYLRRQLAAVERYVMQGA